MTQKECGYSVHPGNVIDPEAMRAALFEIRRPLTVVLRDGGYALEDAGGSATGEASPLTANVVHVTPCPAQHLGSRAFMRAHGVEYAYVAGAMANGIASVEMVEAMARSRMLAFFGAAGLSLVEVEHAIDRLQASVGELPHGFNLIHTPAEPELEAAVVDLYIRRAVRLVEASAFLDLTLPLVRYRLHGIHQDESGRVVTPNRIVAKASRIEVATKFFAPPPERLVAKLVESGTLSAEQAELARRIPMAQDLTAEADSGGHTDNRPAISLVPTFIALRDQQQAAYGFDDELRVGAAGGIATPQAAAAAFSMGAAYILTGSVNQGCVEAGTSATVRDMLAQTEQADITMAPAPDMFEMGVKVQVLKRGTLFAVRGAKLYDLYRTYDSLEAIPEKEREQLEKNVFRAPLETVWQETREFFLSRDARQAERAETDPKHKMALVFRWYLGLASRWAKTGELSRKVDYQVWCGPAMGAFNEWVRGTSLEPTENRTVVTVALNILYGAAVCLRLHTLRLQGVELPAELVRILPLERSHVAERVNA